MNSTHFFYPILIPNNPYMKFSLKKIFLYWVSQKGCERVQAKFLENKNFHGYPQSKVGKIKEISGMSRLKIFGVESKNPSSKSL